MTEAYPDPRPSLPELSSTEAEIAAWITAEAELIDRRAQLSNIIEVDTDENPSIDTHNLADGLHRTKKYGGHAMFIIKDNKKTHELYFRDGVPAYTYSREQTEPAGGEVGLETFHGGLHPEDYRDGSNWLTSTLKIVVTSDKIIRADRVYNLNDGQASSPHSKELLPQERISGAADILDAIDMALEDHQSPVTQS